MKKYKYYYIYLITNKVNNKRYIGQHRSNSLEDDYWSSSLTIKQEIEIYGMAAFDKQILEVMNNDSLIDRIEAYYIGKYDSYENGYNRTRTGSIDKPGKIRHHYSKYVCPHCKKRGNSDAFKNVHFDYCKSLNEKVSTIRKRNWEMFNISNKMS